MMQDTAGITAAGPRLREMNAALSDWDRIRAEGERISREEAYKVLVAEIAGLHAEVERLRLTDAEMEAVEAFAFDRPMGRALAKRNAATLRGLLERSRFAKRESDSPQPIAKRDATPNPPSTPAECTVPPQCTDNGGK